MIEPNPTIIPLGGTQYRRQYHTEPCEYCDSASPWHTTYLTCPVHSILPCSCSDLDYAISFRHYCERCGWKLSDVKEETRWCSDCQKHTLHKISSRVFIGCDGGVGGEECITCGVSAWYI